MSSSAALWRCVVAHAPWSASSTSRAWTALSMPSSMATTNGTSGGTGPSAFLHKQLDITGRKYGLKFFLVMAYSYGVKFEVTSAQPTTYRRHRPDAHFGSTITEGLRPAGYP